MGSKDCSNTDAVKYYCNSYGDGAANNERCLDTSKVLGDDNVASAVRMKGTATADLCLGVEETGAHKCLATEQCNPHAGTNATLCVPEKEVLGHAEAGNDASDPVKQTCIADNEAHATCSKTEICNYGAGAAADICLPNATALADVCVKKNIVVAKHGDQVDAASTPPRVACIGDTHYKLTLAKDTICNFNAASVDDVEVLLADTLAGSVDADKNIIAGGFNKVGEKTTGELNK